MNLHFLSVNLHFLFSWIYTQFISLHFAFKDIFFTLIDLVKPKSLGVLQNVSDVLTLFPIPILYPRIKLAPKIGVAYENNSKYVISIIQNFNTKEIKC